MAQAWLSINPSESYDLFMALGREDGHTEVLLVTYDGKSLRTRINPRSQANLPPPEWWALVTTAIQFSGVATSSVEPLRSYIQPIRNE
jgi:hypothetical protein